MKLGQRIAALPARLGASPGNLLNAAAPRRGLAITGNVAFGPRPDQRLDIYRPLRAADLPLILFFYGGGWHGGSRGHYGFVAASLAGAGAVVLVSDYRLYPAIRFPDFLRDCAEAAAWAQPRQRALGAGAGFYLMGHSAGAYNAVMLGLDPTWLGEAGGDPAGIDGIIGLAGPYDFVPSRNPSIAASFPDDGPATQPVNFVRHDAPPLLLMHGTADRTVKARNSLALAARQTEAGGAAELTLYPRLGHVGIVTSLLPLLAWRAPVRRDAIAFIRASHRSPPVPSPAPLPATRA